MSDGTNERKLNVKVQFFGAAGNDVTGSANLVTITLGKRVRNLLVDCGSYQGDDGMTEEHVPENAVINPENIDAILLTHAHLDHCGEIPYLYKMGYTGEVYASAETLEQASAIMYDSACINRRKIPEDALEMVAEIGEKSHKKAKHSKNAKKDLQIEEDFIEQELEGLKGMALYLEEDVDEARKHFRPVDPLKKFKLFEGVSVRFVPNTHQNGATSIEIYVDYHGEKKSISFSGDIGPSNSYLYHRMDYEPNYEIDACVVESLHGVKEPVESFEESAKKLKELIRKMVIQKKKSLFIGVFALDRSAMILSLLNDFRRSGMNFPVWFDSPLGETQLKNYIASYSKPDKVWFKEFKNDPFDYTHVRFSTYYRNHMDLVRDDTPKVVIVTSCMGYGGRITDYFEHHIQNEKAVFAFAGYLPDNSPSKVLCNGDDGKIIEVSGYRYVKHCQTVQFHGFSSHGYYPEMMKFVNMYPNAKYVFLNHAPLAEKEDVKWQMQQETEADIIIARYDEVFYI